MTNEKHKCHLGLHIAEMKHIVITFEFKISDGDSKTYLNLIYILRLFRFHNNTFFKPCNILVPR